MGLDIPETPLTAAGNQSIFKDRLASKTAIIEGIAVIPGNVFGLTGMFIGPAAASAIAWALLMLCLRARCGGEDVNVTSLAACMEKPGENRRHLTTMSFNRSAFLVKPVAASN